MNSTTRTRRITTAVGAAIVAAGIALGGMAIGDPASAYGQPAGSGRCTGMPMTSGQSGPTSSTLTRAGQVAAAAGPGASDGSMAVDCQAATHG